MTESSRGQAVIINVNSYDLEFKAKPRDGCEKDAREMKDALEGLGFEVDMSENSKENKTFSWMKDKFKKVAKYKENEKFSVLMLMTYLTEEGLLLAYDKTFKLEELWKPFVEDRISPLSNRVRIIIVQVHLFQGSSSSEDKFADEQKKTSSTMFDSKGILQNSSIPAEANILIVYSLAEVFNSEKHINYQSSCIASLIDILKNRQLCKEDILTLMTYLCHLVNQRNHKANQSKELKQRTSISSSLIKSFSFL